jgi:hypothetical protein
MLRRKALRKIGLTPEDWQTLFTSQGYCCVVCKAPTPGRKTGHWATDHDHVTNAVRGILCCGCNLALGHARDNPLLLRQLADYLERFNAGAADPNLPR